MYKFQYKNYLTLELLYWECRLTILCNASLGYTSRHNNNKA